ncbi:MULTISPECIES: hypothetical protein [unclassified Microcoleus]|uniref:hypothetical protein n=1 Tax=unclassified Microcoleus TaxID=2642155 RepID=UPI0025F5D77C|nr:MULTISPECIES: hypothetical protein [unclassified Microcoleus]
MDSIAIGIAWCIAWCVAWGDRRSRYGAPFRQGRSPLMLNLWYCIIYTNSKYFDFL